MYVIYTVVCVAVYFTLRLLYRLFFKTEKADDEGYKENWYGRNPRPLTLEDEDASIRPFTIHVPDEVLSDLKVRLARTRLEEPVEDAKFHYGFNLDYLREIIEYWKTQYQWRKQEEELNKYLHFKTKIEGIDVHFMHVKPTLPEGSRLKVLPLLMIHGWPGSFAEFYKIIPFLTTPSSEHGFVFEIICPSIPGYGFSESPHRMGFDARAAARVFLTMMERIGHSKFYVQGGDWGSAIATLMAKYYPNRVRGLHLNMYFSGLKGWDAVKCILISFFPFLIPKEQYRMLFPLMKTLINFFYFEGAYFHMQSTKPDTIGSGMSDSPAGMAAYLLEKVTAFTDKDNVNHRDGLLTKKFTLDELLTNVMLYWVNNNFTAAARFYKENFRDFIRRVHERVPVTVPSAVAVFPNEILMFPKTLMSQQMKNLLSYTVMPRGGHFAAWEEPELLSDDIWKFVALTAQ